MTVFKAFLRILARNKWVIIMYSSILIVFSVFSLQSNQTTATFEATKPDLYLVNHDVDQGITHALVDYLSEHNNIITLEDSSPEVVSDALFYRQINYLVEIPAGFRADFLAGQNPAINIQSTGDYNASLAEMYLSRFLDVANQYLAVQTPAASPAHPADEAALLENLSQTLAVEVAVELTSTRDASGLDRAAFYYSFMNYPLLVGCLYIISTIMLSFREEKIARRIAVGGLTPSSINRILLGANSLFALALWLIYVLISLVVVDPATMISAHGLWFVLNSLIFTFCATALAFLVANLLRSRNSINGITNVIALGSSFLCGAFVPLTFLPDSVITLAHALPSYWYISANEQIAALETFSPETLWPILIHLLVILGFTLLFILVANLLTRRRRE